MKRLAIALLLAAANGWAQCVMCFRTAAAQNAARARLLNMGIVLLGLPPFCILAAFLLLAWRRNQVYAAGKVEAAEPVPAEMPIP
jgi:hypothetical protein